MNLLHRRSGWSARRKTWLLTAGLTLVAASLAATGSGPAAEATGYPELVIAVALAAVFFLAEQFFVNFEFHKQSHLLTFAGVPLALGILMAPTRDLVLARALGAGVAMVVQRVSFEKIVYNVASYAAEAGLGCYVVHAALRGDVGMGLVEVLTLVIIIAAIDQVISALVLYLVRIHGGALTRRDVIDVLLPSFVLSTVTTTFAIALRFLLRAGGVGLALVCVLVVTAVLVYRAYAATARRHQTLQVVHDFVALGVGAESLGELGLQTLNRIRTVLRAARVQVLLCPPESAANAAAAGVEYFVMEVGEDETLSGNGHRLDPADWVRSKALYSGEATLAAAGTKERAVAHWLTHEGFREAVVAPLTVGTNVLGVVTVADRFGDTTTFTQEDLALLETLTNHLAVAIRGARLLEKLGHDATHDGLTGLANRAQLAEQITRALKDGVSCALLLLDLNKFKEVNDVLGHDVGDRLLVIVAERLQACLPSDSTIARLGGDEFAVLLPNLNSDPAATALAAAHAVVTALAVPVRIDEALLSPQASVGIAVGASENGTDFLRCADTAMYVAKAGDQSVVVYHPDMERGKAERLALVADLRIALDTCPEQFQTYYQPKIDLKNRTVVGAEALVRWRHPTRGLVAPDDFIALAEASGLIDRLTLHVLINAVSDCAHWRREGHDLTVAVNLSPRNMADDALPQRVLDALAAAGLPPDRLVLEITEGSVFIEPERAIALLTRLAEAGISLSLDDFGTGYSSLSYLQRLPVSEIKIDRSFVVALGRGDNAESAALLRGIARLARSLGLRVVAEGVETQDQLQQVETLGCDIGQGYLMSRPLPAQDWMAWFNNYQAQQSPHLRLLETPA